MAVVAPEHWFLSREQTSRRPHFTTGNSGTAFVDGKAYMADLRVALSSSDRDLLISGWRVTSEQILNPVFEKGEITGERFIDAVAAAAKRGCAVKALLFNVPGTALPGPFRIWHAKENVDFAKAVVAAGGEAILDSRLPPVPASSHHQKFIVSTSKTDDRHTAYVGGIDICLDRWDEPAHNAPHERQTDRVQVATIETHTASQPGWHDVQVRLQGPAVAQLWSAFRDRWNDTRPGNHDPLLKSFSKGSTLDGRPPTTNKPGRLAVQINQTLPPGEFPAKGGPGELTVARAHERAIDLAEHYVYVEDQYVWPCSLVARLEAALRRGVHVLMVVARDYDAPGLSFIAKRLRRQVADRLKRAGGNRFQMFHIERDDGKQIYVHSKILIVDDCYASIGSANFNARSLTNDSELQVGIVDTELVTTPVGAVPMQVCKFAHDLRCKLWAEHLECSEDRVVDPIATMNVLWSQAPISPSRRAHKHDNDPGIFIVDPIAEYITTLVTGKLAEVPALPLLPNIEERSVVKLAVDTAIRGPSGALLLKFLEEMLNPDAAPAIASLTSIGTKIGSLSRDRAHQAGNEDQDHSSEQILTKLRRKELPQMVDWIDPALLARIGVRDIISGTIGQYADQRLMQAASDPVGSERDLALRYDFSCHSHPDPKKHVRLDENDALWVDYVADLGDGFEATYAIAHLLAQERLEVTDQGGEQAKLSLPAGQILVMGGDQCYPQGTQQDYERRLIEPYRWAFTTDVPERKLFAIPGNHDWYDGLSSFSSVFTSARDRISGGIGRQIGGWRCHQHRSYWAIKLPHGWWIWGPDIQLEGNLDDPQRDYFDIVSDYTRPGDKIVICLAEPSWHHQDYDNLHEISMLARKNGAKVCAVLAGDWHHYSRYSSDKLGVQFITSGGGGAFAHATHQLKDKLDLQWVEMKGTDHPVADPADPLDFNMMEARIVASDEHADFGLKEVEISSQLPDAPESAAVKPQAGHDGRRRRFFRAGISHYSHLTSRIYPSKMTSRLLALNNLLLPFRNRRFAWFVGFVYFFYAWVYEVSAPKLDTELLKVPKSGLSKAEAEVVLAAVGKFVWSSISPARVVDAIRSSPMFFFMLLGLWAGLVYYVELGRGFVNGVFKVLIGTAHFLLHLSALLVVSIAAFVPTVLLAGIVAAVFEAMGLGASTSVGKPVIELAQMGCYVVLSMLIGGFVGASIMGFYWTVTSLLANMHCGDAFGALMIKDYKHFLRMKFDRDTLTIYPISIKKVPGRKGWRVPTTEERQSSPSRIVPKKSLDPHLIEPAIVIDATKIPH